MTVSLLKRHLLLFFMIIVLTFSSLACGALQLRLTKGTEQKLTVGFIDFKSSPILKALSQKTQHLIQKDLEHSGLFDVISFKKHPSHAQLKQENVDLLLDAKIYNVHQRPTIRYQLMNPYRLQSQDHKKTQAKTKQTLGLKRNWRATAHRISDHIYQELTGLAGIFSTRIAYVLTQHPSPRRTRYQLIVSDIDSANAEVLLSSEEPIMSPAWASNGKQIAYVSFENQHANIFVHNLWTHKRKRVIHYPGNNSAPTWSPDGKKLAFVSTKDGYSKLYLFNLRNRRLRQLTHGWSIDTEPSWAPNGQSLLFTSNRSGTPQIYQFFLKSMQIKRVTHQGSYNAHASFFPDAKRIVMIHRQGLYFTIAVQQLENSHIQLLSEKLSSLNSSPCIAPNGNMILYATIYSNRRMLGMTSADGQVRLRLPTKVGDVQAPAWSPFIVHAL